MRPFLRRAASTRRPLAVCMRVRKPDVRRRQRLVPRSVLPIELPPAATTVSAARPWGRLGARTLLLKLPVVGGGCDVLLLIARGL